MNQTSLTSIVIPTFNQGNYLPSCVDHCLFQTYPNLEIIIVDGGSADGTTDYLGGLQEEIYSRSMEPVTAMSSWGKIIRKKVSVYPQNRKLQVITFSEDVGATRTINEGLKRATGKYCTYVPADDMPHPHMIEEMVGALESTKADFVYSDINLVDDQGRIVRQMRLPEYNFEACFGTWYHLGVSRLYETEWHDKVGLMDETYCCANDYDHYLRFAVAGATFYHLQKVLYSVRYHGINRQTGQHTPSRYAKLIEESKICARRARAWLEEKSL